MNELIEQRTENSKTFDLGNGKRRAEICIGALHYKDDYKDEKEQFKEIDLTWVDNKVTKAPYTLERVGNKINVLDKKTGKTSSIELDSIGDEKLTEKSLTEQKTVEIVKDIDVEIIAAPDSIRYQVIIKDEKALKDLKYNITGDLLISYSAVDGDGEAVPLITSVSKEDILTESVDVKSFTSENVGKINIKYPIKIDPTVTIQGSGIDTFLQQASPTTNFGSYEYSVIVNYPSWNRHGLVNIELPNYLKSSVITSSKFFIYYDQYNGSDPVGSTVTLYKLRRNDWVEDQATWNIYKTGSNWGTSGANNTSTDIDISKTATQVLPSSFGFVEIDVQDIINDALINKVNFNIRVSGTNPYTWYYSTKEGLASRRPKLVIDYYIKRRKIFFI